MNQVARLEIDGKVYELPILVGTEGERAIDISKLRAQSGLITLDDGYVNTGSCESRITFIDGDKGILRYRGYPIETLAERSSFVEAAYLLIFGRLPTQEEREGFTEKLTESSAIHEAMTKHFDAFPTNSHPMAIMSAMINSLSTHERPKIA
ncbi:MAG: citrate/2-methylcitrate synthase, partial [Brooklawnia sp.]